MHIDSHTLVLQLVPSTFRMSHPRCPSLAPATLGRITKHLTQWFLTFFTYLTLLSHMITSFTPNTLNGAIFWRYEIKKLFQFTVEWFIKIYFWLQFVVQ